jgi:hypothetical protein
MEVLLVLEVLLLLESLRTLIDRSVEMGEHNLPKWDSLIFRGCGRLQENCQAQYSTDGI